MTFRLNNIFRTAVIRLPETIRLGALAAAFIFVFGGANAQVTYEARMHKLEYPNEDFYYLQDKSVVTITLEGDHLDITSFVTNNIVYLNSKANLFSRKSIYYYTETNSISKLAAFTWVPQENKKMKKVEVGKVYSRIPEKDEVFYDDMMEVYFDFPELVEGAVTTLSYEMKHKDPHLLQPFFFGNDRPTGELEYSVKFPKSVRLLYKVVGDTSRIRFTATEDKNNVTYTWKSQNQPPYSRETEEGNFRKSVPQVLVYISSYTVNGKEIPVFGDLHQLYDWYYAMAGKVAEYKAPAIKQLADSLTAGVTSEKEKTRRIYNWVQENVQYIAFEYGLGGYVPRKPELVLSRRYGDCKDKACLLYSLMCAAGIPAHLTWIGTRDLPYRYTELPASYVSNHMILSVGNGADRMFLDGTSDYLPLGYPSDFIQGKEALIGLTPDSFQIVEVPEVPMQKNIRSDTIRFSLEGENLSGTGSTTYSGIWRSRICNRFDGMATDKKNEALATLLQVGSNKCRIDSIHYEGWTRPADTLLLTYNIAVPGYARKIEKRCYVNMNLDKTLQDDRINMDTRKTAENYRFKYLQHQTVVFRIPAGYSLSKLPANSSYSGKLYGYTITYSTTGGNITMQKDVYFDMLVKPVDQFKEWNSMLDKLDEDYAQVVVLEQK